MHGAGTRSKGISMASGFRFASLKDCWVNVFGHLYRTSPTFRYAFGPVANVGVYRLCDLLAETLLIEPLKLSVLKP